MNRTVIAALLAIGSAALAQTDYEPKPLPSGPTSPTQRDFDRRRGEFEKKHQVAAYRAHGSQSQAWDAEVVQLLEGWADFTAGGGVPERLATLLATAKKLEAASCDDPLALYTMARVHDLSREGEKALAMLGRAAEGLEKRGFPPIFVFRAARGLAAVNKARERKDEAARHEQRLPELLARAAAQPEYAGGNQRFWAIDLPSTGVLTSTAACKAMLQAMDRTKGVDPWCRALVAAYHGIRVGWDARGTAFADKVTEEGWTVFERELTGAARHLQEAYRLHPEFPEAAAEMITVVTALSEDRDQIRLWFDRSVAAQFDFDRAYDRMSWALLPRWSGSYEQMLAFAAECLETQRWDTRVPDVFWTVLLSACNDEKGSWKVVWRMKGVYRSFERYVDGFLARPTDKERALLWRSVLVLAGYASGHRDDAVRRFQELGSEFDERAFKTIPLDRDKVLAYLRSKAK